MGRLAPWLWVGVSGVQAATMPEGAWRLVSASPGGGMLPGLVHALGSEQAVNLDRVKPPPCWCLLVARLAQVSPRGKQHKHPGAERTARERPGRTVGGGDTCPPYPRGHAGGSVRI